MYENATRKQETIWYGDASRSCRYSRPPISVVQNWGIILLTSHSDPVYLPTFKIEQSYTIQPRRANMISGILIFNQKGENLIFRAYRNDCRPKLADVFRIQVISNPQVRSPILTLGSTTFSHVKHENVYLVAITKGNANAALVFEFLYRLIQLGKGYFNKFDEEAIKNNFVLVYEILDGRVQSLTINDFADWV